MKCHLEMLHRDAKMKHLWANLWAQFVCDRGSGGKLKRSGDICSGAICSTCIRSCCTGGNAGGRRIHLRLHRCAQLVLDNRPTGR